MMKKLRAGTKYYKGKMGHRNFNYPTDDYDTIIDDTSYEYIHFVGGGNKRAVRVPEYAVKHDGTKNKEIVIWIDQEELV